MTHTVQALKSVRRIVLTDYLPGVKMLDLERSQASDADKDAEPARPEQVEWMCTLHLAIPELADVERERVEGLLQSARARWN